MNEKLEERKRQLIELSERNARILERVKERADNGRVEMIGVSLHTWAFYFEMDDNGK